MSPLSSTAPPAEIVSLLLAAGCVFAEDEARLLITAASTPADLARMVDQRTAGVPLEQVVGWAEFCGLRIAVAHGVFVPRRRTELLVHRAAALAPSGAIVLDLCCGSGAVGAALVSLLDRVELHAVDIDPAAVRCARRNVLPTGGRVYEGDLYEPLPDGLRGRVDVLVANVPYVPTESMELMPAEARMHEPRVALDGGSDGLDVLRRVAAGSLEWLAPGGHLLVETSARQAQETVGVLVRSSLVAQVTVDDERNATVVSGRRAHPRGGIGPPDRTL